MPKWKKSIFVNAIKSRMEQEKRIAKNIIKEYIKLTAEEVAEILQGIKDLSY